MINRYNSYDDITNSNKILIPYNTKAFAYSSISINCYKFPRVVTDEERSFNKEFEDINNSSIYKEEVKIGPLINFYPIKPRCNSSFHKLSSDSVNFDLDDLTYKNKENKSFIYSIGNNYSITELKSSKKNVYQNNSTINKVLTTNAKTVYSRQGRSKEKNRIFCCGIKKTRNSKEERNKSYLSTNNTKRSTNLSLKSVILNDSLNRLRKKKEHKSKVSCTHKCLIF